MELKLIQESEANISSKYNYVLTNCRTMSRIGKLKVQVPSNVEAHLSGNQLRIKGPKGELLMDIHPNVKVTVEDGAVSVTREADDKFSRSLHGLTRSNIKNMVIGVVSGFEKRLEIQGVGFRAQMQGAKLVLSLGFSHPVNYPAPTGITLAVDEEKKNIIIVKGVDKQKVGQVASEIRGFKRPEPYKGKGIRYVGEYVRRKAGKSVAK